MVVKFEINGQTFTALNDISLTVPKGRDDARVELVEYAHTVRDHERDEIVRRGAAHSGLTWHFCRPPVRGLEFEMDCRGVRSEQVV